MAHELIKSLFANDIHRRIEEVIKVDQTSDDILRDEINEYVVTDAIRSHYTGIFDAFRETPNKPHEGIAIWVTTRSMRERELSTLCIVPHFFLSSSLCQSFSALVLASNQASILFCDPRRWSMSRAS
jgi:hypothetical protein